MASTNRMSISFGNTEEDHEIYNYLQNSSNASALIRVLVKMYMDGNINFGGGVSPSTVSIEGKQDVKKMIHNKMKKGESVKETVVDDTEKEEITKITDNVEIDEVEVFKRFSVFGNGGLT
ncbi:hypothetical protein UT300003_32070 [Clostridium sardiniense]